jgi:hypothetical protein
MGQVLPRDLYTHYYDCVDPLSGNMIARTDKFAQSVYRPRKRTLHIYNCIARYASAEHIFPYLHWAEKKGCYSCDCGFLGFVGDSPYATQHRADCQIHDVGPATIRRGIPSYIGQWAHERKVHRVELVAYAYAKLGDTGKLVAFMQRIIDWKDDAKKNRVIAKVLRILYEEEHMKLLDELVARFYGFLDGPAERLRAEVVLCRVVKSMVQRGDFRLPHYLRGPRTFWAAVKYSARYVQMEFLNELLNSALPGLVASAVLFGLPTETQAREESFVHVLCNARSVIVLDWIVNNGGVVTLDRAIRSRCPEVIRQVIATLGEHNVKIDYKTALSSVSSDDPVVVKLLLPFFHPENSWQNGGSLFRVALQNARPLDLLKATWAMTTPSVSADTYWLAIRTLDVSVFQWLRTLPQVEECGFEKTFLSHLHIQRSLGTPHDHSVEASMIGLTDEKIDHLDLRLLRWLYKECNWRPSDILFLHVLAICYNDMETLCWAHDDPDGPKLPWFTGVLNYPVAEQRGHYRIINYVRSRQLQDSKGLFISFSGHTPFGPHPLRHVPSCAYD